MSLPAFITVLSVLASLSSQAYGKGGGKAGSGSSTSRSTKSGTTTSTTHYHGVTIVKSGSTTICYNASGAPIRCPLTQTDLILIIVFSSLIGCLVLASLTFWIAKHIKNKRREQKKIFTLPGLSFGKREQKYEALDDHSDLGGRV